MEQVFLTALGTWLNCPEPVGTCRQGPGLDARQKLASAAEAA
ncbi:hypothetical protein [Sphingosinicella microcystinivorans]|nr:hypothetical protein [Sphingosinicella microcystinivorans]